MNGISFLSSRLLTKFSMVAKQKLAQRLPIYSTAQKMKFSIEDFLSKCDRNGRKLRIWSHLLKKSLILKHFLCSVGSTLLSFTSNFSFSCHTSPFHALRFYPQTLLFHDGGRYNIEISPLICKANQWTGFYMITASVMKELKQWPHSVIQFHAQNFQTCDQKFLLQ